MISLLRHDVDTLRRDKLELLRVDIRGNDKIIKLDNRFLPEVVVQRHRAENSATQRKFNSIE